MPYDEDDDLFGEEFDFVDEDEEAASDADAKQDEAPAPKSRRRPPARGREKPPAERPKPRGRSAPAGRRTPAPPPEEPVEGAAPDPELFEDEAPLVDDPEAAREEPVLAPSGPPADHAVHIYEYGRFKRTIPRKFTDEEAVGFAEEYTRTGKAYGRYAVATPDDEEPAPTFAGASKGG